MRFHVEMILWTICLLTGCGGGSGGDLCQDVQCNDPPADSCKDENTLLDYPAPGTCDAATGKCQYSPVEKNCANGCEDGRCLGGGDGFTLQIPADTKVCSLFSSGFDSSDLYKDYAMKGRVTLRAGDFSLPREQETFDADLIQQVEFGPERTVLEPLATGRFTRELQGAPDNGTYRYEYIHSFGAGDQTLEIVYRCNFVVTDGTPEQSRITFDAATLGNEWFDFTARLINAADEQTDSRYYTGCGYPTYTMEFKHTLTMANGDVLTMDQKMIGESICKICNSGLVHAEFTSGQDSREVTEHFRLAYNAQHHNWYQKFLVVFDNPVGNVYGIYAEETDYQGQTITSVDYLDQNLGVIETVDVSEYTVTTR